MSAPPGHQPVRLAWSTLSPTKLVDSSHHGEANGIDATLTSATIPATRKTMQSRLKLFLTEVVDTRLLTSRTGG